jgi:hypothetical protein
MTTPIPNKLTILEKGFEFVPKTGYGVVTSDKGPSMSKRDNGDSAIPTTLASRQLFYYLCPLRALRITCDEYLLLFYMSAPTFGYTVRLNFTPKFYDYKRAVTFAKHIKAEDIQKAREACFRALRELGEKGTYLAQFTVAELTMAFSLPTAYRSSIGLRFFNSTLGLIAIPNDWVDSSFSIIQKLPKRFRQCSWALAELWCHLAFTSPRIWTNSV